MGLSYDSGNNTVSLTAEPAGYVIGIPVYVSDNCLGGTMYLKEDRVTGQLAFHVSPGTHPIESFYKLQRLTAKYRKPYDQETDVACCDSGPCELCQDEMERDQQTDYDRGYADALKVCADDVKDAVENNGLRFNADNPQQASYYESRAREEVARLSKMNEKQYEIITGLREELAENKRLQHPNTWRAADSEQIRELINTASAQQEEINYLRDQDKEWDLLIQDRDEALEEVRQLKDTNAKLLKSNGGWMEAYNHLDQDFEDKMEDRKLYIKDLLARLGRQSDTIRELQQVTTQAFTVAHGRGPDKDDGDF